ncbi:MAG: ATPase, T2SS/T4P/T4SS family [Planctomycetota bacterium]
MAENTTQIVHKMIDEKKVLHALLKTLLAKRPLTQDDMDAVFSLTIQKVIDAIQAQAITIFLLDAESHICFSHVYYSPSIYTKDPEKEKSLKSQTTMLKKMKLNYGQGIVGKVIQTGEPHVSLDVQKDPQYYQRIEKDTGFTTRSMMTVPLLVDKKAIGAIQALNKETEKGPDLFSRQDFKLLAEVAQYSSRIIQKAQNPDMKLDDGEIALYVSRLTKHELLEIKDDFEADEPLLQLVGEDNLRRFIVLPLKKLSSQSLKVAMANPLDFHVKDGFELMTKLVITEVVVAPESDILRIIDKHFKKKPGASSGSMGDAAAMLSEEYKATTEKVDLADDATEDSAPIVQLANRIIEDAYSRGASDIHIEPFETEVRVRFRVDGSLQEMLCLPPKSIRALVARLKIMSELDIAESRLPQDGRIVFKKYTKTGIDVDLRVATAPMNFGEKVVMRLLDKTKATLGLGQLGFSDENIKRYRECIAQPYGMVLHVGPTGSGKSMTLYSALSEINTPDSNIQTAEDPIEYTLKGINQMQVKKDIGLTFAAALRSYLRQDPDIILVGEIRDLETAEIAVEAALTGHLLFSTLHTNDAAGTVTRYLDMGIEPFMVSSSLLVICAQRLMRRLCSKCKQLYDPNEREYELMGKIGATPPFQLYKARGCPACNGAGYKGRVGTHEILTPNDEIRALINKKAPSEIIKDASVRAGMKTLHQDSLLKVKEGITSIEEALANVRAD